MRIILLVVALLSFSLRKYRASNCAPSKAMCFQTARCMQLHILRISSRLIFSAACFSYVLPRLIFAFCSEGCIPQYERPIQALVFFFFFRFKIFNRPATFLRGLVQRLDACSCDVLGIFVLFIRILFEGVDCCEEELGKTTPGQERGKHTHSHASFFTLSLSSSRPLSLSAFV